MSAEVQPNLVRKSSNQSEATVNLDDIIAEIGWGKFHWRILFISSVLMAADGMEIMVATIIGPILMCKWVLKNYQLTLYATTVFVGMAIGSLVLGKIADIYGRRKVILLSAAMMSFYGFLSSLAQTFTYMVIIRGVYGTCLANAYSMSNLLMEFTPASKRAKVYSFVGLSWSIGISLGVLSGIVILQFASWRILLALVNLPSLVVLLFSKWLPESIRFRIINNQPALAKNQVQEITKLNGSEIVIEWPDHDVTDNRHKGNFKELFQRKYISTSVLLVVSEFCCLLAYFGSIFLQSVMLQKEKMQLEGQYCAMKCRTLEISDYKFMFLAAVCELIGMSSSSFLWDRLGRKKSVALSSAMAAISLLPLTFLSSSSMVATTTMFCIARACLASSAIGFLLYSSEVYPTRIRNIGAGLSAASNKIGSVFGPVVGQDDIGE